jgi:hypothetical protein
MSADPRTAIPDVQRSGEWVMRGPLWVRVRERLQACLSEREFFELYLRSRYGDGPTRCC